MDIFNEINNFWFGNTSPEEKPLPEKTKLWFSKSDETDKYISDKFGEYIIKYSEENYTDVDLDPIKHIGLIILFDQFSRNIFRNKPESFAYDQTALKLAENILKSGKDKLFHPVKRVFLYLPFEHSEDLPNQEKSVELFTQMEINADENSKKDMENYKIYAIKHYEIVEKFGRFPHRNKILGRVSTPEEESFLKLPGSSF